MPATITVDGFQRDDSPFIERGYTQVRTMDDVNLGDTPFGLVKEGTPMGVITATKKVRPSLNTEVDGDQSGVTEIDVDDATNAFIGDLIDLIARSGAVGAVEFEANAQENITITGVKKDGLAHSVALIDPALADQPLRVEVDVAGTGVRTCRVYLETGGGAVGAVEFEANAQPENITITGVKKDGLAHSVEILASTGNDVLLSAAAAIAAGVYAITVTCATGGGGAITSTPADVCGLLNALFGDIIAATYDATTTACLAVAAQALGLGVAEDALVLDGVAITAVDKASAQHTITTGSSVIVQDGDVLRLDNGAETAIGLSSHDANTYTGSLGSDYEPALQEPTVDLVLDGAVIESRLPVSLSEAQKTDLFRFILE